MFSSSLYVGDTYCSVASGTSCRDVDVDDCMWKTAVKGYQMNKVWGIVVAKKKYLFFFHLVYIGFFHNTPRKETD